MKDHWMISEDGSLGEDVVNNVLVSFVLPGADVPHQVAHARHKLLEIHLQELIECLECLPELNVWKVHLPELIGGMKYNRISPDTFDLREAAAQSPPQGSG